VSLLHRKEDTLTRVYRSYLTWEIIVRYDRGICESVTRKRPDRAKPLFNFVKTFPDVSILSGTTRPVRIEVARKEQGNRGNEEENFTRNIEKRTAARKYKFMLARCRFSRGNQSSDPRFLNFVHTRSRKADSFPNEPEEKEEEPSIFPYEKAASRRPHESRVFFAPCRPLEADFQVLWGIGRGEETSTSIDRDALKASARHNPLTLYLYHDDRGPRDGTAGAERTLGRAAHFHQFVTGARWRVLRY